MQDQFFTFLAGLDSAGQEEFIRKQTAANLISLDRTYGYGQTECSCPPIPIPCPEHMARGVLVGHAIINGATGDVGELSDRELFKLAWPDWKKRTRCDCPTLWEPCEHALAHKAGDIESPLTDAAKLVLLQLVHQVEQVEHATALVGSDAGTHETKSVDMAARQALGFGVQSQADFLTRTVREAEDRLERDPNNGPNGQPDPGPIQLKIFEPDSSPTFKVCVCGERLEGAEACADCTRALNAMAKTMGRKKKRRAAV